MTTMLAAIIGALIGSAATLGAGWWARQAGRRGAELAEAANVRAEVAEHRATAAEHRASVVALLGAGFALAAHYDQHRPGGDDPAAADLVSSVRLAASPAAWPPSSRVSATAASWVYVCAVTVAALGQQVPGGAGRRSDGPAAFRAMLGVFELVAAAEADYLAGVVARVRLPAPDMDVLTVADGLPASDRLIPDIALAGEGVLTLARVRFGSDRGPV